MGSSPYYGQPSSPHDRPLGYPTGAQGASLWRHAGSGVAHFQFVRPDVSRPRALRIWTTIRGGTLPVPPVQVSPRRGLHRSRCGLYVWETPHPLGGKQAWLLAAYDALGRPTTREAVQGWLDASEPTRGTLLTLDESLDFTAHLEGGNWRVAAIQVPTPVRDAMDGVLGSAVRVQPPKSCRWSARATDDATQFQFWYQI